MSLLSPSTLQACAIALGSSQGINEQILEIADKSPFFISVDGIWRVLRAPGIPIERRKSLCDNFRSCRREVVFPFETSDDDLALAQAAAAVMLMVAGLEILQLRPRESKSESPRPSVNRQVQRLSREIQAVLLAEKKAVAAHDSALALRRRRDHGRLISEQLRILGQRDMKCDSHGSQRERFIRYHLVAAFEDIYQRRAGHSHLCRGGQMEVDGPFVRFVLQFCSEVGLDKVRPGTIAAALSPAIKRRKKSTREGGHFTSLLFAND